MSHPRGLSPERPLARLHKAGRLCSRRHSVKSNGAASLASPAPAAGAAFSRRLAGRAAGRGRRELRPPLCASHGLKDAQRACTPPRPRVPGHLTLSPHPDASQRFAGLSGSGRGGHARKISPSSSALPRHAHGRGRAVAGKTQEAEFIPLPAEGKRRPAFPGFALTKAGGGRGAAIGLRAEGERALVPFRRLLGSCW